MRLILFLLIAGTLWAQTAIGQHAAQIEPRGEAVTIGDGWHSINADRKGRAAFATAAPLWVLVKDGQIAFFVYRRQDFYPYGQMPDKRMRYGMSVDMPSVIQHCEMRAKTLKAAKRQAEALVFLPSIAIR